MGRKIDASALVDIANMLIDIANGAGETTCSHGLHSRPTPPRRPLGMGRPQVAPVGAIAMGHVCRCEEPSPVGRAPWGVAKVEPLQDKNKRFGINIRVDEPVRSDFSSQWAFERAHEKFDRLVDAAEAVNWENKSNTAPLHRVNAVRRRIEDGPVMGLNLCGETRWWD